MTVTPAHSTTTGGIATPAVVPTTEVQLLSEAGGIPDTLPLVQTSRPPSSTAYIPRVMISGFARTGGRETH